MEMNINIIELKQAIHETAAVIRTQKRTIRTTPHEEWSHNLWTGLRRSKARATLLCAIRAHSRGRLHMRTCTRSHAHLGLPQIERFTLEQQARFIGERWQEFSEEAGEEMAV